MEKVDSGISKLIGILIGIFFAQQVAAIEISTKNDMTRITGVIEIGDYEKVLRFYEKHLDAFVYDQLVQLDSPGGSVSEAMKIASFLGETMRSTSIEPKDSCMSSCFFMFLSGGSRMYAKRNLGIHRPYYKAEYFGSLTSVEARNKYAEMDAKVREFLKNQQVPDEFISKMFSTPSESIYLIPAGEFEEKIGFHQPWFEELGKSSCKEDTMYKCMKYRNALDRLDQIEKFFGSAQAKINAKWIDAQRGPLKAMVADLSINERAPQKKVAPAGSFFVFTCQIFLGGDRSSPTSLDIAFDTKTMMAGRSPMRAKGDEYSWDFTKTNGDVVTTVFNKNTRQIAITSPRLGMVAEGSCKPS